jgi:hypothetical protein
MGGLKMEKWIIENMNDCLRYGYSFKWFIESREYYLENYSVDELKKSWNRQKGMLSRV